MTNPHADSRYGLIATVFTIATVALLLVFGGIFATNTVIYVGDVPQPTATLIALPTALPEQPLEAGDPAPLPPDQSGGGDPGLPVAVESEATAVGIPTNEPASYPYLLLEDISYEANTNDADCDWLSIAGRTVDRDGRPVEGLPVEVRGGRFEAVAYTGTSPRFGDGGFEIQVHTEPLQLTFEVQLLDTNGTPISAPVAVETSSACERNVAVVVFAENPDYGP